MDRITGDELTQSFASGVRSLERHRDLINSLNVFPVPDGDTGTNMLLTARAAMDRCPTDRNPTASDVAAAIADGAFWGARGNSGVILSEFFKGFAEALDGLEACSSADLERAFGLAADAAYRAVGNPVEGTMLSVMRALASAVTEALKQGDDSPASLWETAFRAAGEALARTPEQLPVLREAGVVDAGGMGVVALIGGALCHLTGRDEQSWDPGIGQGSGGAATLNSRVSADFLEAATETHWGYCTQFVIEGEDLDPEEVRRQLGGSVSDSAVVVGGGRHVRVHVHADDPGPPLTYGVSLGQLSQINIQNMSRQNREFAGESASEVREAGTVTPGVAVVAVVPGDGLANLFQDAGCAQIISGGQTMNPSVGQLMAAVAATGASDVIILPNNKNVVLAAEQAAARGEGPQKLYVVPSRTAPQGVAALLAFNPAWTLDRNLEEMNLALATVTTIEVTCAVRDTTIDGVAVAAGDYLALTDGEMAAVRDSPESALIDALTLAGLDPDKVVTLYRGADAEEDRAASIVEDLEARVPGMQVELVYGGQPHYPYLASVE